MPLGQISLLVCGGRDFSDYHKMFETLDTLNRLFRVDYVVHGDARGADKLAGIWGGERVIPVKACPALWHEHGRRAGPIRNAEMLDLLLRHCQRHNTTPVGVCFPGGSGTEDMHARMDIAKILIVDKRFDK